MKIGFYGNSNNYPFILARAIRAKGHEVLFVVTSDGPLDRPEHRYAEVAYPYPDWVHDFSPHWKTLFPTPWRRKCVDLLRTCDAVILNHFGPSLLSEIDRPAIILLTGSDLDYLSYPKTLTKFPFGQDLGWKYVKTLLKVYLVPGFLRSQREGIRTGSLISYFHRGLVPEGDRLLDELGVGDSRRTFLQMTEPDLIPYCPPPNNNVVRTFCATRLNWKKPMPPGYSNLDFKGTDIMIRGLGHFFRSTGRRLDVRLVRKGLHVKEAIELVADEGIADQVTWLDEMTQREVLREFREADIVFEQLDRSAVGMAGLDAMATGRPLIANGRPEIVARAVGAPSPICQAKTPEEVSAQLLRLVHSSQERQSVGVKSREYVEKYFSAEWGATQCIERLKEFSSSGTC